MYVLSNEYLHVIMRNLFLLCLLTSLSLHAYAQSQQAGAFTLGASVNALIGSEVSAGGSIQGRYLIKPQLAIGLNLRFIPVLPLLIGAGVVDYFFSKNQILNPYLGLEAGVYKRIISYRPLFDGYSYTVLGMAPKLGIQPKLSPFTYLQTRG
jgi:hypothetical protein